MAIQMTNKKYSAYLDNYQYDFIADTDADVKDLPQCCPGSTALVVESGTAYMVNASGSWAVLGG